MKKSGLAILLSVALALPGPLGAAQGTPYSPENLVSFTQKLIQTRHYYRAYVELKRIQAYYPEYISPIAYYISEGYLLFQGKRYKDLTTRPILTFDGHPKANIYTLDAELREGNFKRVLELTEGSGEGSLGKRRMMALTITGAHDELNSFFATAEDPEIREYRSFIATMEQEVDSFKSPGLAATLGLVPGMGYMYGGEIGTGIVAFLVISLTAGITYLAFRENQKGPGIFIGAIGTFFYGGNILGSYLTVRRKNKLRQKILLETMEERLALEEDRQEIFNKYGLGKE